MVEREAEAKKARQLKKKQVINRILKRHLAGQQIRRRAAALIHNQRLRFSLVSVNTIFPHPNPFPEGARGLSGHFWAVSSV